MKINNDDAYDKLLAKALTYVSYRPRTHHEVATYITKKIRHYDCDSSRVTERVMERLTELGYINDRAFVLAYIENQKQPHQKGMRVIREKLQRKGIEQSVIEELIVKENVSDEFDRAKMIAVKKMVFWKKLPVLEIKKKLYGYLIRQGFSGNTVYRVIDDMVRKDYNE